MSLTMLFTMIVCFALSISIAVSIGISSLVVLAYTDSNMLISVKEIFNALNKFPLAAIPFFILAGNIMETGGISRRLVEFAKSVVGGGRWGYAAVGINVQGASWFGQNAEFPGASYGAYGAGNIGKLMQDTCTGSAAYC